MAISIKALAVTGDKQIEIKSLETPDLRPKEALVKVHAVALCTLEQRVFRGGMKLPLPFVGGHEVSGEVVALGDGAKGHSIGDRVVVRLLYSCGECYYCRTGHTNMCVSSQRKPVREGLIPGPGGLCDYIVVDTSALFPIASGVSYEEASLTEPLACCVHSIQRANIEFGEDVVVIGGGIMGQLQCILARLRGARVIISEMDEQRRELALKLGASVAIDPSKDDPVAAVKAFTDGRGADVVINTTPIASVFAQAVQMTGRAGRMIQYSSMHPDAPTQVSPQGLHNNEIILTGSISPDSIDFFRANRLINAGTVDVKPFIAAKYAFNDAQKGFERAITPGSFRVIITD